MQFPGDLRQVRMLARNHRLAEQPGQPLQLGTQHPAVGELEQAEALVRGPSDHGPERRVDRGCHHTGRISGTPRRQAERAREGVAEPAV